MNRRQFLRAVTAVGGIAMATPFLEACARAVPRDQVGEATQKLPASAPPSSRPPSPAPTAHPTATPPPDTATIALVSTNDRADGARRAMELLGAIPVAGQHVLLKPNFNSTDPSPGSTDSDVLRTIVAGLSDLGARSIAVGDRAGMGETRHVMQQKGVFELAKEFGLDVVVFDELPDDAWHIERRGADHWSQGYPVPKLLLDADSVVQTCNLKTHGFGGHFSVSLKNSVGFVAKLHGGHDYMDELHDSADMRTMIAEVNAAYDPTLIVVDGVEAFVKGGPATGTRAPTGVVLAGSDRIAIDAVCVAILRLFGTTEEVSRGAVFEQEQIARAVELGLGVDGPKRIVMVADDPQGKAYAARIADQLML